MISKRFKFIFIHIPRTGGTSIETIFKKRYGVSIPERKHRTILFYKENPSYTNEEKQYRSFTFIRNPWVRTVSLFLLAKMLDRDHPLRPYTFNGFKGFVLELPKIMSNPKSYKPNVYKSVRPMYDFIMNKNDELVIDWVGQYEYYLEDWDTINSKIGVPPIKLPRVKYTRGSNIDNIDGFYTSKQLKDIVAEVYKEDIEFFGYTFNSDSTKNNMRVA